MSELKIVNNSLENAILKDGQFVFGQAYTNNQNVNSSIISGKIGALAHGYTNQGIISSDASGAIAGGYASLGIIKASQQGAIAHGYSESSDSSIISSGKGSYSGGIAHNTGRIVASADGAHAEGKAEYNGYICAEGVGAYANGYATGKGTIYASQSGAHAEGFSQDGSILAIGQGAHAEGRNTNALNTAAHSEGYNTTSKGQYSHAEGEGCYKQEQHCTGGTKMSRIHKETESLQFSTLAQPSTYIYNHDTGVFLAKIQNYWETGGTYAWRFTVQNVEQRDALLELIENDIPIVPVYTTSTAPQGVSVPDRSKGAIGYASHVEGVSANAIATASHAGGIGTTAYAEGMTAIGKYNTTSNTQGAGYDVLFCVGNGRGSANSTGQYNNAFTIYNNRYISPNAQPKAMVSIYGDVSISGDINNQPFSNVYTKNVYTDNLISSNDSSSNTLHVSGNNFVISSNGNAESAGNITANAFYQTSDIRKKNIKRELDLEKCYDLIDKCSEIVFEWKDKESDKEHIGMIAQEVQEFFPEIVNEDSNGYLSLDYSKLTVICLRVLKDLINEVKMLKNQK